ncbi:hypothetical protein A3K34_03670 [candidate division WWE3 bacterium RIFOXYC1_FULL_40_10]|uniref:Tetratricopeptide repeat protein n=1 Tax=candidate division WWE3 bacterium RIFOXYA2_FULL_46_9 TaxID=1802636 RepID=A0A1F4W2X1_UNCKA|nr:MAG: hypothetical protein A3K58_03670 [candidate division WWE3 bacterium RIFOXYB1_FULL_40_22]OGC61940.1 MAG: hypothetical protein A3K37_03670 [candidate division WWE3 bacterium RIFOXYA1_FULL_40_11]OGC63766.1 MAG: hypothetical protein A2264_02615 [candidate division WWE3 bacterium RIFOXYA2_FULL_46_9]OGC64497.1 MAG: hypothetical protein A2326_03810 [candidate division WWE3 bacterium RIFOXYB2_FULL_41_6]OGC66323.1 MAG: hypothetical protein A3K34_03670 [candidate division WWE3 bacterium RIFOXYC1_
MSDYKQEISQIASLREAKGKEQECLDKISQLLPKLAEKKLWASVAKMYWESHLVWQHTAMSELTKPVEMRNQEIIANGSAKMMEFAKKAIEVIESHNIEDMFGGAYRFLGRAYTFVNDHEKAKECYETAINKYRGKDVKSKLEVSGFLADALIRLGKPIEGLHLAEKTYEEFHNSESGKNLKEEDYFTWAVWMSGIAPRVVKALLDTGIAIDKNRILSWLEKVKEELTNPTGVVRWGDPKFEFRINEIDSAIQATKVQGVCSQ